MTTKDLLELIAKRDALNAEIDAATTELKLDAKGVKALQKAVSKAAAAQKTLDALMGIGVDATVVSRAAG